MAYVDRTLTQAENAQQLILEAAPVVIARMTPDSPNHTAACVLFASAYTGPVTDLPQESRARLASYAATMHRQPPHPRTIVGLLRLLQIT